MDLEFPRGKGRSEEKNPFHGGGVDIFGNYTLVKIYFSKKKTTVEISGKYLTQGHSMWTGHNKVHAK